MTKMASEKEHPSAVKPYLAYVHGYGWCLYNDKVNPLKLHDEGEITDDKELLRDTFNGLSKRIATLEAENERLREYMRRVGEITQVFPHPVRRGIVEVHMPATLFDDITQEATDDK